MTQKQARGTNCDGALEGAIWGAGRPPSNPIPHPLSTLLKICIKAQSIQKTPGKLFRCLRVCQ